MKCISPITIRNPKTGVEPRFLHVPCSKCNFCLQEKRKGWSLRLFEEFRVAESAHFVTLTYNDQNVPIGQDCYSLCKSDAKKLMKKLGDAHRDKGLKVPRYYLTGEYGTETERPHYHLIIFNLDPQIREDFKNGKIWKSGHTYWRNVGVESIEYVTKYMIDADQEYENKEKPFHIMSKRPGLGENYINRKGSWNYEPGRELKDIRYYALWKGNKHMLPRYYKDRIFPAHIKPMLVEEGKRLNDLKYEQETERLKHFMEDPHKYMEDARRRDHDNIKIKSLKLNSL